jgi:hypothetical protein
MRPPSVDECFRLLENGTVDAVAEAELAGRASVTSLGLGDKVRMIDQPLALTTYHVLISKSHPHSRTILYYANSSLEKLRTRGEYDRIIERQLARFLEGQAAPPNPAIGATPAGGGAEGQEVARHGHNAGSNPANAILARRPAPRAASTGA